VLTCVYSFDFITFDLLSKFYYVITIL
jgi:hypothetical protein